MKKTRRSERSKSSVVASAAAVNAKREKDIDDDNNDTDILKKQNTKTRNRAKRQYGKACGVCRLHHRTCDGERPCSYCIKLADNRMESGPGSMPASDWNRIVIERATATCSSDACQAFPSSKRRRTTSETQAPSSTNSSDIKMQDNTNINSYTHDNNTHSFDNNTSTCNEDTMRAQAAQLQLMQSKLDDLRNQIAQHKAILQRRQAASRQKQAAVARQISVDWFPMERPKLYDCASFEGLFHIPFALRDANKPFSVLRPGRKLSSYDYSLSVEQLQALPVPDLLQTLYPCPEKMQEDILVSSRMVGMNAALETLYGYSWNDIVKAGYLFPSEDNSDAAVRFFAMLPYMFGRSSRSASDVAEFKAMILCKDKTRMQARIRHQYFYNPEGALMFCIICTDAILQIIPPPALPPSTYRSDSPIEFL